MDHRTGAYPFQFRNLLEAALALSLFLCCFNAPGTAQSSYSRDLYAGIELGSESIKAIAIRIASSEDGSGVKLINSEVIDLSLDLNGGGANPAQLAEKASVAVEKLRSQLEHQSRIPPEHIYIVGRSGIDTRLREELSSAIKKLSGKTVAFLDQATETQLSIVGVIPKRERAGAGLIDNRTRSVLIDIGNYSTRGGYELLRYSPTAQYDFVTMNVARGTIGFSDEVLKVVGVNGDWTALAKEARTIGSSSIQPALRDEIINKPGLLNRKRVYLTGGIVTALATLLYPAVRQNFVPLTAKDIADFATQALRNQPALLKPNLSAISDRKVRQEVEKDLAEVRSKYTSQQLIAGAELLKVISTEFNWQDKNILFVRFGHLGCVLSYIRLQAEK
jgi:hypothetical protein